MAVADARVEPAGAAVRTAASSALLTRLAVRDFRNLARVDFVPPADGFALVGENGQGKTNLLEAIHYLQLLRSFRGARDVELVRFDTDGFHVSADVANAAHRTVQVGFERASKRKRVLVDGDAPPKLADALGAFPAVLFSPRDAETVAGAPGARRRFLDMMLALSSRPYLSALQQYRAALAQRSAAMRQPGVSGARQEQSVAVWEAPLAEHGAVLWRARREWTLAHGAKYVELCAAIGERAPAAIRYASGLGEPDDPQAALRDALARNRATDVRRGLTHTGPHRDDLVLTLGGRDLRAFGSAGQQRTAAIALKLLESATRRATSGRQPVVLLDDPFAELDARRAARILELLGADGSGQTVLAVPRADDIPERLTRLARYQIAAGVVRGDRA
ncbi:MAG TPA: DNA replication and repair protein RecF [Gemmatimonadaceae bacterium]|nr:DNA replication and repair protein RecF [Gemmatimonadaceae bacterium]